jgi:hypothetical protein
MDRGARENEREREREVFYERGTFVNLWFSDIASQLLVDFAHECDKTREIRGKLLFYKRVNLL